MARLGVSSHSNVFLFNTESVYVYRYVDQSIVDDIKDVLGQAEEENVIPAENNMYKIRIRPLNVLEVSYNANLTIGVYNAVKRIMDHSRHGLNNHIYERRTFERPMDGLSHRLSDLKLRVSRLESACLDRGVARFSLGY